MMTFITGKHKLFLKDRWLSVYELEGVRVELAQPHLFIVTANSPDPKLNSHVPINTGTTGMKTWTRFESRDLFSWCFALCLLVFCRCSGASGYPKPLARCAATCFSTITPEDRADRRSVSDSDAFWNEYGEDKSAIGYRACLLLWGVIYLVLLHGRMSQNVSFLFLLVFSREIGGCCILTTPLLKPPLTMFLNVGKNVSTTFCNH